MQIARSRLGQLLPTVDLLPAAAARAWPRWTSGRRTLRALLVLAFAVALISLHLAAFRAPEGDVVPWLCILLLLAGAILPWKWTAVLGAASTAGLISEEIWRRSAALPRLELDVLLAPPFAALIAVAIAAARSERRVDDAGPAAADQPTPDSVHARVLRQQTALAGLPHELLPQALLPALRGTARSISTTLRIRSTEIWSLQATFGVFELLASDRVGADDPRTARLSPHVVEALRQGGIVEAPPGSTVFEGTSPQEGSALLALATMFGAPAGFVYALADGSEARQWFPDEHLFLAACAANVSLALESESRRTTESRLEQEVYEGLRKEREVVRLNAELAGHIERRTADLERANLAHVDLQEALRRASRDWTATFDSMQFPLLLLDDGGRLVRCNQAACTGLGRQAYAEVLGRRLTELSDAEPWRSLEGLALETVALAQPQTCLAAGDGRSWELSASVVSAKAPRRVAVLVVEVTRLLDLQEAIRRASTLSAVGSLVAGVAHEVRNPLFAMSANLDGLEEEVAGSGAHFASYVRNLRREMDRVERLMRDLLDYARPQAASRTTGSIVRVVEAAAASARKLQRDRGAALAVAVVGEPAFELTMDAHRLEQVFANLVENALHFTPLGGDVHVEIAFATDAVVVTVADQGPGFAAGDLERVFDPLFSRRQGGTGLGLAIAQRIVDEHGGRITAANGEGGGGRVVVTLPRRAPRPA